jgi:hypothetical protein
MVLKTFLKKFDMTFQKNKVQGENHHFIRFRNFEKIITPVYYPT